jgi:N-acetylmuramoyl-L-alanine amidase
MTNTRSGSFFAAILLLLFLSLSFSARAGDITLRLQVGERTFSIRGYDSSGVVFVSVRDYASSLSLPWFNSAEWKKIEIRLPNHRVKVTARSPFVVITNANSGESSKYQLNRSVFLRDSLYFAPALQFVELLEFLSPSGMKIDVEGGIISSAPTREGSQYDITGLAIESRQNGYLLTIKASRKLGDYDAFLSGGWLYVRVSDATADTVALSQFKANDAIRRVVIFQQPTSVQLTFRVSPDIIKADPLIDEKTQDLLVSLPTRSALDKIDQEKKKAELEKKKQKETQDKLVVQRERAKLDVVVIDAGHGGKDPGTIGVAGTREKDVALGVALKLGRLIEQRFSDTINVVYTRKNDTFVELDRRGTIANEAGGKLFISIHCNSTERKPSSANGFEIYLLRPGKTESAIRIAAKENDAIKLEDGYRDRYPELTQENFILMTMRQSAFVRYSEEFAEQATETLASLLKIQNSGVKQAGFYVLVGASMPNVLVETGYLSNRKEEKVLRSADGQMKIARALLDAIIIYKSKYENALEEGRPAESEHN